MTAARGFDSMSELLAHLRDDCHRRDLPPEPSNVRRGVPGRVDSIMVRSAHRDEQAIVLISELAVVEVMQIDGPRTADDADCWLVGAFPVFAEPESFPSDPRGAVYVVGIPTSAGPSAGSPGRSGTGRPHVRSRRPVRPRLAPAKPSS